MRKRLMALVLCALSGSCTVGLDSVLFVTKTGLGADLDSQPPTVDLGYSRKEAVIAPVFQDGEVLPVLTTIGAKNSVFNFVSNQSFATGDAALVMADALGSDEEYFPESKGPAVLDPWSGKDVPIAEDPGAIKVVKSGRTGFWGNVKYFLGGDRNRRRFAFGTDTSFGIQVGYSGANNLPRSLSLGWKRKEAAHVPLIEKGVSRKKQETEEGDPPEGEPEGASPEEGSPGQDKKKPTWVKVRLASLIATAKGSGSASKDGDVGDTRQQVMQTYATGAAATLMAGHPHVRDVLGKDLFEDYDAIKGEAEATLDQSGLVNEIKDLHEAADEEQQKRIRAAADALFNVGPIQDINELDGVRDPQDKGVTRRLTLLRDYAKSLTEEDES